MLAGRGFVATLSHLWSLLHSYTVAGRGNPCFSQYTYTKSRNYGAHESVFFKVFLHWPGVSFLFLHCKAHDRVPGYNWKRDTGQLPQSWRHSAKVSPPPTRRDFQPKRAHPSGFSSQTFAQPNFFRKVQFVWLVHVPVNSSSSSYEHVKALSQDNKAVSVIISPVNILNIPFPNPVTRFVRRSGLI
jgi:hypothetical protein